MVTHLVRISLSDGMGTAALPSLAGGPPALGPKHVTDLWVCWLVCGAVVMLASSRS